MSAIFFLRAASSLIGFGPSGLDALSTSASNARRVVKRESIHAVFLVIVDVHLWNASNDPPDQRNKLRKPFYETSNTVDAVMTLDVVTEFDEALVAVVHQNTGQRVVAVTIPVGKQNQKK